VAVDPAAAERQRLAGDGDRLAARVERGDQRERLAVRLLSPHGDDETAVADVEVRVRHDDRRLLALDVRKPRQLDDVQAGVAQPAQVVLAGRVVRVRLVGHGLEHDPPGLDERADVVDVAVGVVVLDKPGAQPDDALRA
jgi:hypothetical protein